MSPGLLHRYCGKVVGKSGLCLSERPSIHEVMTVCTIFCHEINIVYYQQVMNFKKTGRWH